METNSSDVALASAIARAVAPAHDLQELSRPLLALLERVTGLDSVYLTAVHWQERKQEIVFAHNAGKFDIPEGVVIDWTDTLCRRSLLEGRAATPDVEATWGFDHAAGELGYRSYVSVPVITSDGGMFGTLCAAGSVPHALRDADVEVMHLFARLMGGQIDRDRALARERARVVAAESRTRDRALLIAAAEHKLKTPLTVVAGIASTLATRWDEIAEPERRTLVGRLDRRCGDLIETVDAMVAESRADDSTNDLQITARYVLPALQATAEDFGAASDRHQFVVRCDPELICLADPGALDQALGHLVENAMKYSPGGPIELAASAEGNRVVVSVSDAGPGLPPGDLFEPFVRGEPHRDVAGTGLGLHIVRTLVRAMDGSIDGSAAPGGGAMFRISLQGC